MPKLFRQVKKLLILMFWSLVITGPSLGLAQNCDTSAVQFQWNGPGPGPFPIVPIVDMICLDSTFILYVHPKISCSSVAANGSNFRVIRPDSVLMYPIAAMALHCIGDSASSILVEFNQPFYTNMLAKLRIGASDVGTYIESACAKRPWVSDSLFLSVQGCFTTNITIKAIAQTTATAIELNWELDPGTPNAPFPWYLLESYRVYRKLSTQNQFVFLGAKNHIDSTRFVDEKLPTNFIGTIHYVVSAKVNDLELDFDTASVHVALKSNPVAYPVPFQDQLEFALTEDGEKEVTIFNQQGQPVFTTSTPNFYLIIQTGSWPKGVYFIRVSEKEETVQRVVKL